MCHVLIAINNLFSSDKSGTSETSPQTQEERLRVVVSTAGKAARSQWG